MNPYPIAAAALSLLLCLVTHARDARPNFLVILCDDLGYADLGCFGHPHVKTPNLDRLAQEGMRMTDCYSASPVCSPSRVGLLTGRMPNRAGVYDWIPAAGSSQSGQFSRSLVHLRREETTLPALLRSVGYATAMAGKWHCNSRFNDAAQPQPSDAGFDYWFGTQNNASPSHRNPGNYIRNGKAVGLLNGYSCEITAAETVDWLERHRARAPDVPFFLYVAFHEPHEPVASPENLVDAYRDIARNREEAEYFANVENVDRAIGVLLEALDRRGTSDNTLVFFTSDNGPETLNRYRQASRSYGSAGPLRGMKLWTTEGGVRVPGIIRWPGKIAADSVTDAPVSSLDVFPTFCGLAGVAPPGGHKLDGVDIHPLLLGRPFVRSQPLFWVYFNALNEQRVALRDGPWKLMATLDTGALPALTNVTAAVAEDVRRAQLTDFSLYHLPTDPGERNDLAAKEHARLNKLSALARAMYREMTATMHVWPDEPPR